MKTKYLLIFCALLPCLNLWAKEDDGVVTVDPQQHTGGIIHVQKISAMTYTLTAEANAGYHFQSWDDGTTNKSISYTHVADVTKDKKISAIFVKDADVNREGGNVTVEIADRTIPSFLLTAHEVGSQRHIWNNGSTDPTVSYVESDGMRIPYFISNKGKLTYALESVPHGSFEVTNISGLQCQVKAVPEDGYTFLQWLDGNTDNPRTYEHVEDVTADKTLYAVFTKNSDITRPHGHVDVTIPTLNEQTYRLQAIPDPDCKLVSWINNSKEEYQTYTEADGTLYPLFAVKEGSMTFSYDPHPGGTIQAEVINGLECRATAIPAEGYDFLSWADGGQDNPRIYTHVKDQAKDSTMKAIFVKRADIHRPHGNVAVTITDPTTPAFELTAQPDGNAHLKVWNNGSENPIQAYVETDNIRIPFFVSSDGSFTLVFDQHPGGVVTATHKTGSTYDVTATANDYYEFLYWADGVESATRSYTHTADDTKDSTLHAVFAKTADIHQTGGSTIVEVNDKKIPSFKLTAEADASCASLYRWSIGPTTETIDYVETDGRAVPYFSHGEHAIIYDAESKEWGTIIVEPIECGFILTAHANPGYNFKYWEDNSTNPTREVEWLEGTYTAYFGGYVAMVGTDAYSTLAEAVVAAEGNKTITLLDNTDENIIVPYPIKIDGANKTIGNMTILCGGSVDLTSNLTVNGLYLNTMNGSSAQLFNESRLTCSNAYLDVTLEPGKDAADPIKWFGLSTPFEVDAANGICRASGNGSHVAGTDYLVWTYDSEKRASTGNGWEQMPDGTMQPGRFYMFEIDGTENVWRFAKKSGSALAGGATEVNLPAYSGTSIDGGWNAIGNGLLHYANASINDIPFIQVYDNIKQKYEVKMTNATSFVVGCPFFAQVAGENTLVLSDATHSALFAPKQAEEEDSRHMCELRFGTEEDYDVAYITAAEDAQYQYEIGRDLLKMGISTTSPGIWLNDYGHILCVQDAALSFNEAYYALSLFAPNAGQFTLTAMPNVEGDELYLTEGGSIVWNLTDSPCTLNMRKGTDNRYGLILLASDNTSTPTGTGNLNSDSSPRKEMRNQILYIIRNGVEYNVLGGQMKK